jgi:hypothetical protein
MGPDLFSVMSFMRLKHKKSPGKKKKLPISGSEPTFGKNLYGTPIGIVSNNCYAYAIGNFSTKDGHKLQPGEPSGDWTDFELSSCKSITRRVLKDNKDSYVSGIEERCRDGFTKIFIALSPGVDYHFYLQHNDVFLDASNRTRSPSKRALADEFGVSIRDVHTCGPKKFIIRGAKIWSHKRGISGSPELVDASGKLILNPRNANRSYGNGLNYTKSCESICIRRPQDVTAKKNGVHVL